MMDWFGSTKTWPYSLKVRQVCGVTYVLVFHASVKPIPYPSPVLPWLFLLQASSTSFQVFPKDNSFNKLHISVALSQALFSGPPTQNTLMITNDI